MPCEFCARDGRAGCPIHVDRWPLGYRLAALCVVMLIVDTVAVIGLLALAVR